MSYEPRPGALAYRVLAYLALQPKGFEITSGKLAAELDVDSNGFIPHMTAPLNAGLIFRRKKDKHPRSPIFWSLVDHSKDEHAAPPPGPQKPTCQPAQIGKLNGMLDDDPPVQRVTKVRLGDADPVIRETLKANGETLQGVWSNGASKPEPKPEVEQEPKQAECRVALWSDGTLQVQRDGADTVFFTRAEARAIVDYLNTIDLAILEDEAPA